MYSVHSTANHFVLYSSLHINRVAGEKDLIMYEFRVKHRVDVHLKKEKVSISWASEGSEMKTVFAKALRHTFHH